MLKLRRFRVKASNLIIIGDKTKTNARQCNARKVAMIFRALPMAITTLAGSPCSPTSVHMRTGEWCTHEQQRGVLPCLAINHPRQAIACGNVDIEGMRTGSFQQLHTFLCQVEYATNVQVHYTLPCRIRVLIEASAPLHSDTGHVVKVMGRKPHGTVVSERIADRRPGIVDQDVQLLLAV